MLTTEYLMRYLNCSIDFAEMMIREAQGDTERLYDLFLYQLKKRHNTPPITQIEV